MTTNTNMTTTANTTANTSESSPLDAVRNYYAHMLATFGPTPNGVDWRSADSQALRFEQLLKVCDATGPFSINDYGCGYGALIDHLDAEGYEFRYTGLDISPAMLDAAEKHHAGRANCRFVAEETQLDVADYTVASGILNVKLTADTERWHEYVLGVLDSLNRVSRRGFAFNVLTSYSDAQRMRPDLYYADPCFLFDHCKRRYSKDVALLHDYELWEFTMLVRKTA